MKQFFAIVLLSVHLFYMGGYTLLFQYGIHRADVQMIKQVYDNKINDAKLIEIKIPVHMPTILDWTDYEVIAGQIQLKDAYYNYVRFKMTRDTMYFVCLPNTVKTHLEKANVIVAKQISDVPFSKKGDSAAKRINTFSEYNLQAFKYHYLRFAASSIKQINKPLTCRLNDAYIESPGKPPNFIS